METIAERKLTLRCQFCETWNRIDASRAGDRPKCGKCGTPMVLERPVKLDDETFTRPVEESQVPVLVAFYADWCGPCKMVAPVLEELSKEYEGKVNIYKVDTEAEAELADVFGIRSIPTFLFIPLEGAPMLQPGALPKNVFEKVIVEKLVGAEKPS